jgi:hypothetical protein
MLGPQFLQSVRSVARRSGQIAPELAEAWPEIAATRGEGAATPGPSVLEASASTELLVLRAPPVRWEDHATLAGDRPLIAALRESAAPRALLLPLPEDDGRERRSGREVLRRALARCLADLWRDRAADDAQRRDIISAARAANRLGNRLRQVPVRRRAGLSEPPAAP